MSKKTWTYVVFFNCIQNSEYVGGQTDIIRDAPMNSAACVEVANAIIDEAKKQNAILERVQITNFVEVKGVV